MGECLKCIARASGMMHRVALEMKALRAPSIGETQAIRCSILRTDITHATHASDLELRNAVFLLPSSTYALRFRQVAHPPLPCKSSVPIRPNDSPLHLRRESLVRELLRHMFPMRLSVWFLHLQIPTHHTNPAHQSTGPKKSINQPNQTKTYPVTFSNIPLA